MDLIPGLGRSPGKENGNPLQYSCLENPIDRGATVHEVSKSPTQLSRHSSPRITFSHAITTEKAMAPHSSTLAWKTPWMEAPGGLQSMASLRVRHDRATSLSLFTFMHWKRKWHPTPVLLHGKSHGWRSLVGCRLWGRTESDTTEAT